MNENMRMLVAKRNELRLAAAQADTDLHLFDKEHPDVAEYQEQLLNLMDKVEARIERHDISALN